MLVLGLPKVRQFLEAEYDTSYSMRLPKVKQLLKVEYVISYSVLKP